MNSMQWGQPFETNAGGVIAIASSSTMYMLIAQVLLPAQCTCSSTSSCTMYVHAKVLKCQMHVSVIIQYTFTINNHNVQQ